MPLGVAAVGTPAQPPEAWGAPASTHDDSSLSASGTKAWVDHDRLYWRGTKPENLKIVGFSQGSRISSPALAIRAQDVIHEKYRLKIIMYRVFLGRENFLGL